MISLSLYLVIAQITSVYAILYSNDAVLQTFNQYQPAPPPPPIYTADAVVLMEASTGMVLYSTMPHEIKYPASTTKVMTALVVLENAIDLNERIEFSERAIRDTPRYSSHIAMDVGETLTVYQALYALMLPSANEVSIALAEFISGSVEEFVELMNRRAVSLGAFDTFFANPSGLPGAGHVTTAFDMALIMREAITHPIFVDIINTRRFDIPPTERQPEVRALRNTNRLIHEGQFFNEHVVGSKTGWTSAAGHTLITFAARDGRYLIASVLGGESNGVFHDTTALLEFGFSTPFMPTQVFNADANTPAVPVFQDINGQRTEIGTVHLRAQDDVYFDLPQNFDRSLLWYDFVVPQGLAPPIEAGVALGNVGIFVGSHQIGVVPLRTAASIALYAPSDTMASEPGYAVGGSVHDTAQGTNITSNYPALLGDGYTYYGDSYFEAYETPFRFGIENDILLALLIPLSVSVITIAISLTLYIAKRKSRQRRRLHARYARYPHYYRYR